MNEKLFYDVNCFGFNLTKVSGNPIKILNTNINFNEDEFKEFLFTRIKKDINLNKYPTTCIIAGGYLLGLTMEFFGWSPAKHTDIDIFQLFYGESEEDRKDEDFQKFLNEYGDLYKFYIKSNDYEILGTSRIGKINNTKITISNNFNWTKLITDFDINATKIGIKIDNNGWDLFIAPEFLDFLNSKELFPTINGYLEDGLFLRTFARLLIKKEQYPFLKLNDYFIYQMAIIYETKWFNENFVIIKNIGKEKIETLKRYFHNHPYIRIHDETFIINNKEVFKIDYNQKIMNYLILNKRAFLTKSEINRIIKLSEFPWLNSCEEFIVSLCKLFEKDYSYQDLNTISKICSHKNRLFQRNLREIIKNINEKEILLFFNFLNKNQEYIGFLETLDFQYRDKLIKVRNQKDLIIFKKKIEKITLNWEYKPIKDLFIYSKYIRELISQEDLNKESFRMNHCVKGYWLNIASGKERIFHLNYKGNHSTFSIQKHFNGNLVCSQHKAKNNNKPNKNNEIIKDLFVNYLNKSNFQKIIKD